MVTYTVSFLRARRFKYRLCLRTRKNIPPVRDIKLYRSQNVTGSFAEINTVKLISNQHLRKNVMWYQLSIFKLLCRT